jgi:mannose-1-phosphate guanylyltransferase/mannose-1-phosphate guanylyltransferase/mannose-6-phosphate isomerase
MPPATLPRDARIYVAGHRGLVGGALLRYLQEREYSHLITRRSSELDLRDQAAVQQFFAQEKPEYVFLAAAKVGGILANATYPAQFLYDNLTIATNVIHASYQHGVRKLLNLGSSCIYPRLAPQPLKEEYLLTGPLEETNRAYAVAKIAAIELCDQYRAQYGCDFISAMPTNLYGPGDNFDLQSSHVLPALIRKMLEAKKTGAPTVEIWGSGTPLREFLHVDDLAEACHFLMTSFSEPGPINVGSGRDISIKKLALLIREIVGYEGELVFDTTKPDGTPRKLMDVSRLTAAGWQARISLREGIGSTLEWYFRNEAKSESAAQESGLSAGHFDTSPAHSSITERTRDLMKTLHPVVLSGGSGTRLWPLSRNGFPKQLLALTSPHSMLQETLLRFKTHPEIASPTIICNQEHRFLIAEQLREIEVTPRVLMLEPSARNTAPATVVAALHLLEHAPDALMLVLPADHLISDVPAFYTALEQAVEAARAGYLVTFGIQPQRAETGYGYIQSGATLESVPGVHAVSRFVEKPDAATAQEYVESGDYLWNSGIFIFDAQNFIDEVERLCPDVLAACRSALAEGYEDLDFFRLGAIPFSQCPAASIDCALMERTDKAAVVPVDMGWNDVGSWTALWETSPQDESGNVMYGEVYAHNMRNSYVKADKRLIATIGVDDLVIVETVDAILVAHKNHAQDVKKIVERLAQDGRTEHAIHRKVYRPWGSYEGVEMGERFQVKSLIVKPGQQSSMQKHYHRAEHWIVVSGTAEVTIDGTVHLVTENESIYIPQTAEHRIHNPGRIPLHFIEVQSGAYLGEDDIVRTQDNYGRERE